MFAGFGAGAGGGFCVLVVGGDLGFSGHIGVDRSTGVKDFLGKSAVS